MSYRGMSAHRDRLAQRLASEGCVAIHRHGTPVALLALNGTGYELQRGGAVVCAITERTAVGAVAEAERMVGRNPSLFTNDERS